MGPVSCPVMGPAPASGDRQPGDRQPGDRQPGDRQPGDWPLAPGCCDCGCWLLGRLPGLWVEAEELTPYVLIVGQRA